MGWDILINYKNNDITNYSLNYKKSIFIMFTWRKLKYNNNISELYFKNIFKLLSNKKLHQILKKKNYYLFFTLL